VPLTALDRTLLQRCLNHEPGAWNDFVDRYLGLIYHVVHHTAHLRSVPLSPEDTEDVAAEILLQLVANNYAILRQFRGQSSLATYLTVIARRICIHELVKHGGGPEGQPRVATRRLANDYEARPKGQVGLENLEEVQKLLGKLPTKERQVVRLFYFEGRTYEEISTSLHIPVNSIGPILSRARQKLRKEEKTPASMRNDQQPKTTQQPNA
jgi:RNA polymerase sigma-70 factor (ECF subfamily)